MSDVTTGVGVTLMNAFAKQLRGTASTRKADNGGTIATLVFETPSTEVPPAHTGSEQDG